MKNRLSGILLSLALIFGMMPALGMPAYAGNEQSEEFTTDAQNYTYEGAHFKISVTEPGDDDGFDIAPEATATIESLHGEIITKAEFIIGAGSGELLTAQSGTVTYTQDTATVSEVNDTSLTVGGNDDPLNVKAVKVCYTEAVSYPLWVDGVQVTSANRGDVLANDVKNKGKVSYTPAKGSDPAVLRLSGATVDEYYKEDAEKAGILYTGDEPLKIVLKKGTTSSVTDAVDLGIYSSKADIIISGEGALSVTGGPIYSKGDLTIEGGSVTSKATQAAGAIMGDDDITITGGSVEASAADGYGIYAEKFVRISDGTVTASGKRNGIYSQQQDGGIEISGGSVTAFSTGNKQAINPGSSNDLSIGEDLSVRAGSSEKDAVDVTDIENWKHTEKWVKIEATAPIGHVSYWKWDDTQKKLVEMTGDKACKSYIVVDSSTTSFRNGKWYVVNSDVTVDSRIYVGGKAHLILCDNATRARKITQAV